MDKLISQIKQGEDYFGSGGRNTEEFNKFFREFKKEVTKELKKINATDIEFSKGHFYLTGFFRVPSGQLYYISISDVRWSNSTSMLLRTAEHNKDWRGGSNSYIDITTNMFVDKNLK